MSHEIGGGPYREAVDPNALALENMRKKIEAEGKHGVLLPAEIKLGDEFPELTKLLNKKTKPEKIALYSPKTGILRLKEEEPNPYRKLLIYRYENQDGTYALRIVFEDKETTVLHIIDTSTNNDLESGEMTNKMVNKFLPK